MKSGTTQQLHSYIEYQRYLIDEMVYNKPTGYDDKPLQEGYLQKWNKEHMKDISKLEGEIKRLQTKYQNEQTEDTNQFYRENAKNKRADATITDEIEVKAPPTEAEVLEAFNNKLEYNRVLRLKEINHNNYVTNKKPKNTAKLKSEKKRKTNLGEVHITNY